MQLQNIWLGQQFTRLPESGDHRIGFQRSIRPTRTLFYGGLQEVGACRLPNGWTGCTGSSEFCDSAHPVEARRDALDMQRNNKVAVRKYTKLVSPIREGVLSRLQFRMSHIGTSNINNRKQGDYASRYFPGVYEALETRGLVMPVELAERLPKPHVLVFTKFMKLPTLKHKINKALLAARNSTDGSDVWLDPPELNTIASTISLKDILPHSSLYKVKFKGDSEGATVKVEEQRRTLTSPDPVTLPAFANDHSELFLASMIERQADSWDLHLTTFLLCEKVLVFKENTGTAENLYRDRDSIIDWSKASLAFKNATYQANGARTLSPRHFCKITTKADDKPYTVEGIPHSCDLSSCLVLSYLILSSVMLITLLHIIERCLLTESANILSWALLQ